jgi:hypothetical protein
LGGFCLASSSTQPASTPMAYPLPGGLATISRYTYTFSSLDWSLVVSRAAHNPSEYVRGGATGQRNIGIGCMGTRNDLSEDLRSGATENRNIMNISGAVLPKEKSVCHLLPVAARIVHSSP